MFERLVVLFFIALSLALGYGYHLLILNYTEVLSVLIPVLFVCSLINGTIKGVLKGSRRATYRKGDKHG